MDPSVPCQQTLFNFTASKYQAHASKVRRGSSYPLFHSAFLGRIRTSGQKMITNTVTHLIDQDKSGLQFKACDFTYKESVLPMRVTGNIHNLRGLPGVYVERWNDILQCWLNYLTALA